MWCLKITYVDMKGDIYVAIRVYKNYNNAHAGYSKFLDDKIEEHYNEIEEMSDEEKVEYLLGDEIFSRVEYRVDPIQLSD